MKDIKDDASAGRLLVAATMHKGRSGQQQDAMCLAGKVMQEADFVPARIPTGSPALIAIADGVAASPTAARVSLLALQALDRNVHQHPEWSMDGMINARHVRAVQQDLCDAAARGRLAANASTTLVAAQIRGNCVAIVNSGDSRAYLLRGNDSSRRLSRDHSELQNLLDSGEAEAGVAYASVYDALSDCLVAGPYAEDFAVHHETTQLASGDRLILCSDGVHDVLSETEWLAAMRAQRDPLDMVVYTRHAVLDAGAPDNFSMLAVAWLAEHDVG